MGAKEICVEAVPGAQSKRAHYIRETLRLNFDPFLHSVAELELQINPVDPPFFSYFVHPPYDSGTERNLLERIRQPQHSLVYGEDGSGKTMLRYALEAECRALPDRTLVVSFPLGKEGRQELTGKALWRELIRALAVDLFIQTSEQFSALEPIADADVIRDLADFWTSSIPNFERRVRRMLADRQPQTATGISAHWWPKWGRAAVRYVPLSSDIRAFWQNVITQSRSADRAPADGPDHLDQGVKLAQLVGYQCIYLLVDVVGEPANHLLEDQIGFLFRCFSDLTTGLPIYLKSFIPLRLQGTLERVRRRKDSSLTGDCLSAIINWSDPDALLAIISNRFRGAGSWIEGFDNIAGQDIAAHINQLLVQSSRESPRRLLRVVNLLIETHANRAPAEPTITAEDWQRMTDLWGYDPPGPALFQK